MSTRRRSMASRAASTPVAADKPPLAGFWDDGAVLAMPAQRGCPVPDEDQTAARGVARWAMLAAHGCTGKRCRSAHHAAGAEVRDELLEELGLT